MQRRFAFLLIVLLAALALTACTSGTSPTEQAGVPAPVVIATAAPVAGTHYPLSVPTSDGGTVTLTRVPARIISLSPGATEILFAIGAGGQVIATDRFSTYPDAVAALPKVDYSNPNTESLVALRPDLVLAALRQRTLVPVLEQVGLKVLLLEEPGTIAGVIERVRLLGRITGQQDQAERVASGMETRVTAIKERVNSIASGPRTYHEIDPKLFAAGPASFVGDLYTLLKARNVAPATSAPYPQLSAEAIIAADPEVIILGDGKFPGGTPDEVKRRPGWGTISALKSGRVYPVDDDLVSRPGPRVVEGLEQIARLLYPELFR